MQASNSPIDTAASAAALEPFFAETAACFDHAARSAGRRTHKGRVGPFSFSLEFAGPALEPRILPAFGHRIAADAAQEAAQGAVPDLRVFLWDAQSTGIVAPVPPWEWGAFVRNEVFVGDRFKIVYKGDSGSLLMYDAGTKRAVCWVREADHIPYYETGAPLLPVMNWWLESKGCQLAHAGAVGGPDGGVLLVGRGGSGKSTTALACLAGGLEYAGDDYCVLAATAPVRVHSLYCSAKLAADSRDRLPGLTAAIYNPRAAGSEKTLYFLNRLFPDRMATGFPLRAVLLPRISGTAATAMRPVSPAVALRALAPSTIFQLAGAGGAALRTLASILRSVPCFEFSVGLDLARIPEVVRSFLQNGVAL